MYIVGELLIKISGGEHPPKDSSSKGELVLKKKGPSIWPYVHTRTNVWGGGAPSLMAQYWADPDRYSIWFIGGSEAKEFYGEVTPKSVIVDPDTGSIKELRAAGALSGAYCSIVDPKSDVKFILTPWIKVQVGSTDMWDGLPTKETVGAQEVYDKLWDDYNTYVSCRESIGEYLAYIRERTILYPEHHCHPEWPGGVVPDLPEDEEETRKWAVETMRVLRTEHYERTTSGDVE